MQSNALCGLLLHGTPPPEIYTLSLHDALPILLLQDASAQDRAWSERHRAWLERLAGLASIRVLEAGERAPGARRSEEHTSELQSRGQLVCRLLLEKKKIRIEWVIA